jgi:ribosomal protein S8
MTLNQKQLCILRAIKNGQWRDEGIAQELSFEIGLVRYYLDFMEKQGYIKIYGKSFDAEGRSSRVAIELEYKGDLAINNPDDLINEDNLTMNNINFNAPINAPIGVLQNSDGNTVNIIQNNNQNIQEIINSLEFLEKEIQDFPDEEKQEALVYLDSLKTEIKEKQDPAKIRTFFKGFMRIVIPLASFIVNGADFANNVTDLATKFDVDITHISLPFK